MMLPSKLPALPMEISAVELMLPSTAPSICSVHSRLSSPRSLLPAAIIVVPPDCAFLLLLLPRSPILPVLLFRIVFRIDLATIPCTALVAGGVGCGGLRNAGVGRCSCRCCMNKRCDPLYGQNRQS